MVVDMDIFKYFCICINYYVIVDFGVMVVIFFVGVV